MPLRAVPVVFLLSGLTLLAPVTPKDLADYDGKVHDVGGGRYDAYMIPPQKSNHASFLELLPSGELVMAWFSGTSEGADLCSIYMARLPANSSQWSKATLLSQRKGYSNQNPVFYYDSKTGDLNLWHSQQVAVDVIERVQTESNANVWHLVSSDGRGLNWTKPVDVFTKAGSFDRNRIIESLDGGLIFPIYFAVKGDENQHSAIEISHDHKTWKEYTISKSNYLVQPSIVRPTPNKSYLASFFRDRRKEYIYTASSTDEGESWSEPKKTVLPNNNAAIQAYMLASGHMAIVFNPTHSERVPIRIAVSEDGGKTWPHYRDLEPEKSVPATSTSLNHQNHPSSTEFSYPTLLQSPDGYIHISYTYNRDTIKYVKIKESWIYNKE